MWPAGRPAFQALVDRQEAFLLLYRTGAFAESLPVLAECAEAAQALGWRQGYYEMMRERVDGLIDEFAAGLERSVCRHREVTRSTLSKRWSAAMSAAAPRP